MSSTTVSNPYSFNISGNTGFSASVITELPNEITHLWTKQDPQDLDITFTIPIGVNILRCNLDVNSDMEEKVSAYLYSYSKGDYLYDEQGTGYYYDEFYIGVTPGKTYRWCIGISAEGMFPQGTITVFYSASINQQKPSITDY